MEPYFHFGRMNIHVNPFRIHIDVQQRKRELVLHQISLVACLQSLGKQRALNVSSIHKEKFKIPVGADYGRASQEAFHFYSLLFYGKRNQFLYNLPSVNAVDNFLQISVSGGMEPDLPVHHELKSHIGPGKRHMLHQIRYIAALRGRGFQEFFPDRRIKEKLPDNDGCALRCAYL